MSPSPPVTLLECWMVDAWRKPFQGRVFGDRLKRVLPNPAVLALCIFI